MSATAKSLALARLRDTPPPLNPQVPASNGRANPDLTNSRSMYVAPISRADQSTLAPGGSKVDRNAISPTYSRVGKRTPTSPGGRDEVSLGL